MANKIANVVAWGGSAYPWHSSHVITVLVIGFVALIAFVIYGKQHSRVRESP
jgi:hypothetical protein